MSISLDEVSRIAKLSKLDFFDAEKQKLQQELSNILEYVDQLKKIESKVELNVADDADGINLMRDDVAIQADYPEDFLAQAPGRQGKFIKVKSILE